MTSSREQTLALLDEWINTQRALLAQTNTDIQKLQRLKADPLNGEDFSLSPLPVSPPSIPWDWSGFNGRDCAPFFGIQSTKPPRAPSPRPLSEFVHNAKAALLIPFFEKWDLEWDPAPVQPPRLRSDRQPAEGGGRTVISYLSHHPGDEAEDVDIDLDDARDTMPSLPPPRAPSPQPLPLPSKKKRKREPSPNPGVRPAESCKIPQPSHATKSVPAYATKSPHPYATKATPPPTPTPSASNKPRSGTFNQSWSESEQNLLERLLEQYPDGQKNRWKMISLAMGGRRTPRQVASRVQKYLAKLKKFGLG
ncbi:hypothetical protein CYLTODRAFT_448054 [Cylindrobasidium torrendii FP15055 ss-10]|uniref:Uncharacterized protein n=1 Tax=Cylindrobasidium torrendii FP15055 ss-10 TaxID=1314674 RepID=A0A0D7BV59_9AGAR|nr:hypothetical protein CYLTODRAFT_448054 [Cylindrobasidium torrendii FP15055 ss-10]